MPDGGAGATTFIFGNNFKRSMERPGTIGSFGVLRVAVCSLGLLLLILAATQPSPAVAGVINEEYLERQRNICEPRLLERRAAEHIGRIQRHFNALIRNSVWLRVGKSLCSGTFVTPTCVLTAAHCLNSKISSRNIAAGNHLYVVTGGRGIKDEHYVAKKGQKLKRGWVSGDDIGLVIFQKVFKPFQPIRLSYARGNLNAWFFEAEKPDRHYKGQLKRFDYGHWQDLGTLGLAGFTSQAKGRPLSLCSDSVFHWAPCFAFVDKVHRTPLIERGVLCHTGEMGPGMSGGSFYNERSLFGILIEGPRPPDKPTPNFIPIRDHWWYRHPRSYFSSNVTQGLSNRAKLLLEVDRDFVLRHCPGADLELRKARKGLRVRDPSLAGKRGTNRFWLPGGRDVWRTLKFKDRTRRVNRKLRAGDRGEFVRRLQVRLLQLELYKSAVDGNYGASTAAAVRQFQARRDLIPTGIADKETLIELGMWFNKLN